MKVEMQNLCSRQWMFTVQRVGLLDNIFSLFFVCDVTFKVRLMRALNEASHTRGAEASNDDDDNIDVY
jgi:hypothetical protein